MAARYPRRPCARLWKTPEAAGCRDQQLKDEESQHNYRKITSKRELTSASGVPVAIVQYQRSKKPEPYWSVVRAFVAKDDLCADIELIGSGIIPTSMLDKILSSIAFDPDRQPDFLAKFRYATALYEHHRYAEAAPIFENALSLVGAVDDAATWRRVATDQASIAYGMSGELKHSRAVNEAAIAKDPDYPLYYYDLACVDAEEGNAAAARAHLQQAFDRRQNIVKGESLPDPT